MAGWILRALRLAGALLSVGGLVWSGVAWICGGGVAVLGAPEYASLLAMFTVALAFCCWQLCHPSRRLEAMSEDILRARRSLDWIRGKKLSSIQGHIEEEIRIVSRGLDGIKVPHPPIEGGVQDWYAFLVRLQAEAKTQNVRCARTIWEKIQREQED